MANYNLTKKAVQDLSEIWKYTFNTWSENQADHYYQMLLDCCEDIADNRVFGKNYEGIIESLLGIRAGKHIIFYRIIPGKEVEIVRILHEQMDLKHRIQER